MGVPPRPDGPVVQAHQGGHLAIGAAEDECVNSILLGHGKRPKGEFLWGFVVVRG